jgi:hypothetical protein
MPFQTRLAIEERNNGETGEWLLVKDLVYVGAHQTFTVPQGFVTDLASVPRVFWTIYPPFGRYQKAAVLHDFLCVTRMVSYQDAHGIFRRIMRELGVSRFTRWTMWSAVRVGGPRW